MSLRVRLLLALVLVVFLPLALLSFGLRYEVTRRLSEQYERQLDVVGDAIDADLRRTGATVRQQLTAAAAVLPGDNRFRAALSGVPAERQYLLDWAATAMPLTGMSLLQLFDEEGRILSSGHFRNEHGRVVAGLGAALRATGDDVTFVRAPGPDRPVLALTRLVPATIGDRRLTLVGGMAMNEQYLERLAGDRSVVIELRDDGTTLATARDTALPAARTGGAAAPPAMREVRLPIIVVDDNGGVTVRDAALVIVQPRTYLVALLRRVDAWFVATAAGAAVLALLLAFYLSSRVTKRLAALADKTAVIDLDRLDMEFDDAPDEVGRLSRVLGDLTARLRAGTARIREAERRATVGDLARQINHDIRNGLIPLRNVMRHLAQVGRDDPASVAAVLAERRQTIDSSIGYLETLATNYERLSSAPLRRECDVHALIEEVARGIRAGRAVDLHTTLDATDARVFGDPIAIRRILENLVGNAVDSLEDTSGHVAIATTTVDGEDERALRVTIADTGRGMSPGESARIFEHFYSTKPGGSGLGLSIVRRLVTDLHGSVRVESEPGQGTSMIIDLPVVAAASVATDASVPGSKTHARGRRQW